MDIVLSLQNTDGYKDYLQRLWTVISCTFCLSNPTCHKDFFRPHAQWVTSTSSGGTDPEFFPDSSTVICAENIYISPNTRNLFMRAKARISSLNLSCFFMNEQKWMANQTLIHLGEEVSLTIVEFNQKRT